MDWPLILVLAGLGLGVSTLHTIARHTARIAESLEEIQRQLDQMQTDLNQRLGGTQYLLERIEGELIELQNRERPQPPETAPPR